MSTEPTQPQIERHYRVQPSVGVGLGVVLAYLVLVNGIQVTTGIDYDDWFDTASNTYRTAVIPLLAGSVLLIAFLAWARWDMVWRDPARLSMSTLMRATVILFVAAIVVRLIGIAWGEVPGDLLVAVLLTSVLVGFAEETLFRGVFLRCMRTGGRGEGSAALWTAIAFGLFHLPNLFLGTGLLGAGQLVLAATSGATLYLFRRQFGLLLAGMVAHGVWDFSAFLDDNYGADATSLLSVWMTILIAVLAAIILVKLARHERHVVVTPDGVVTTGEGSPGPSSREPA